MNESMQNPFARNPDSVIKNARPCTSEEDVKATIALNEKMRRAQDDFRSRSAMSKMAVRDFVFTT